MVEFKAEISEGEEKGAKVSGSDEEECEVRLPEGERDSRLGCSRVEALEGVRDDAAAAAAAAA